MIESFFEYLAYRKRNENDLSDITWALCNASHSFQTLFLNFFFPEAEFINITRFDREKSFEDCRPDFYIENKGLLYLIECKIYDCNHHFEQYVTTFKIPNNRLGYITNYRMSKEGFEVKTWEGFYILILDNLPDNESEKYLWVGYAKYLKSICSIIKIRQKMNLRGMYSLYSIIEIFKKLVDRKENEFELKYYSNKNIQGGSGISGCYFEINYTHVPIKSTWAWIGVYYERENPLICLGFENKEGWGKPVCDIIINHLHTMDNDVFSNKPYHEDGTCWFELSEEKRKEFDSCDLDSQIKMLKDFLDEVILRPVNLLNNLEPTTNIYKLLKLNKIE